MSNNRTSNDKLSNQFSNSFDRISDGYSKINTYGEELKKSIFNKNQINYHSTSIKEFSGGNTGVEFIEKSLKMNNVVLKAPSLNALKN